MKRVKKSPCECGEIDVKYKYVFKLMIRDETAHVEILLFDNEAVLLPSLFFYYFYLLLIYFSNFIIFIFL